MKYLKIAKRLAGLGVNVYGMSSNPLKSERYAASRVLEDMANRRVMYMTVVFEEPLHCFESIKEFRDNLTSEISNLGDNSQLKVHLKSMRASCLRFAKTCSEFFNDGVIQFTNSTFDQWKFIESLVKMREQIAVRAAVIAVTHGHDVNSDLKSMMPPKF